MVEQGKRNRFLRVFRAKRDKGAIAAWGQDLGMILNIFNVCSLGPLGNN